jgi:iron complex transport system substrate-binding protein
VTSRAKHAAWLVAAVFAVACYLAFARNQARDVTAGATPPGRPRIVALVGGVVDTLYALGALDCLVGLAGNSTQAYPGTEGKTRILSDERGGMTNAEAILALRPDYVFVAKELVPSLAGRGLNVVPVPQDSFPEMREFVMELGRIVGKKDEAVRLLEGFDAKRDEIARRVAGRPRVRVYWEDSAPGRTRGPGTAVHEMIQLAGGENVYQDAGIARPTISLEAVLAADPEVIVLNETSASPDEIRARQGWEKISAVRNGRIHVIPFAERAVTLYSPRCAECCERTFLRWFHPEVLTDEERH